MRKLFMNILLVVFLVSCGEDTRPRPKAFLALEYPEAEYEPVDFNCPYSFEKNKLAAVADAKNPRYCWKNLKYEAMNAEIFLTYQPVNANLDSLLRDAQKLPLQHTIKADLIEGDTYINEYHKTYGMFYTVDGDAASQAQFYLTDSVRHFLTGSVYFNAQPNFDSILPAAAYIKADIRHLMESVQWIKN